jgi:hypothetical protein
VLSYPVFEVGAAHAGTLLPEVVPRVCDAAGIESVVRAVVSGLPLPPAYAERHSRVSCPWLERLAYAAAPTSER